jgi:hypothetical protein
VFWIFHTHTQRSRHISDEEDDDDGEGLADIRDGMSTDEIAALDESLQPVRLVLVKVNSDSDSN